MKTVKHFLILGLIFLFISGYCTEVIPGPGANKETLDNKAFQRNKNIGRGINFGNALEAPNEGEWGLVIKESYIQAVADAGFNSVRLPICWSAHTSTDFPHTIDTEFLNRVDEIMDWCLTRGLVVIITIHHFNDLYNYPENLLYRDMFFAIWKQLTERYLLVDHEQLFFEVLNEPQRNLTTEKWNKLIPGIIDTIRTIDNDRTLIIDAPDYGNHNLLEDLKIPETEQNVIVSVRYYLPYGFTHQGAWWSDDLYKYLGTTWTATPGEKRTVLNDISYIKNWSENNNRPITIGEYGSIMYADNQSRLTWTNYVRTQFDNNGFSWNYFDFGVVFKVYSIVENRWLNGFVEALSGDGSTISDGRIADSTRVISLGDSLVVTSYVKTLGSCTLPDSVKVIKEGTTVKIITYHDEQVPAGTQTNTCANPVKMRQLSPGDYTLIFISDYIDEANTLHYSIFDTIEFNPSSLLNINYDNIRPLKIYPVQAGQQLFIENVQPDWEYRIYDLKGKIYCTNTIDNGNINISNLNSGLYIIELISEADIKLIEKIIVLK